MVVEGLSTTAVTHSLTSHTGSSLASDAASRCLGLHRMGSSTWTREIAVNMLQTCQL